MKFSIFYWLLLVGVVAAFAQEVPKPTIHSTNDDATELTALATEAGHAYARRDLAALARFTADDYTQTDVRGGVLNRAQWLEFVKNRKSDLTVETDDVQVSFLGSAAVVRGRWTYSLRKDGKETTTLSRWTSAWTRYPDGWKRHVFQNTYVNANADHCALEEAN